MEPVLNIFPECRLGRDVQLIFSWTLKGYKNLIQFEWFRFYPRTFMNDSTIAIHLLLWTSTFLYVSNLIQCYSFLDEHSDNTEQAKWLRKQSTFFYYIALALIIIHLYFFFIDKSYLDKIHYLPMSGFIIILSLIFYRIISLSIKILVVILLIENIFLFTFNFSMLFLGVLLAALSLLVNILGRIYLKNYHDRIEWR